MSLKIHTDDGIYGLEEPYLEIHPDNFIPEVFRLEEVLIGKDPSRIEELWRDMYNGFWSTRRGVRPPNTRLNTPKPEMGTWRHDKNCFRYKGSD